MNKLSVDLENCGDIRAMLFTTSVIASTNTIIIINTTHCVDANDKSNH